ncbi:MAG: sulfotransferase [Acidobacteriaceae bacterium]|nr:sulfotransferase [Acidobacteriaceae bacterium]
MRMMLDAHPEMASPPETGFLPRAAHIHLPGMRRQRLFRIVTGTPRRSPTWHDFGIAKEDLQRSLATVKPFTVREGVRTFYRLYAANHGKVRFGDKTPLYALEMPAIQRLLPEARFIHLIRDGRDVALSLRKTWFAPSQEINHLAQYWKRIVTRAREDGNKVNHYLEVRFEDLVTNPEKVLSRACAFLDLPYDPAMLLYWKGAPERLKEHKARQRRDGTVLVSQDQRFQQQRLTTKPPQAERVGIWVQEMTPEEKQAFADEAGDLLRVLGYDFR